MFPSIFPSLTCSRRQFLHKVWPTQLAFLHFILFTMFLSSSTLCHTSLFTGSAQLITTVIFIIKYLMNFDFILSWYVTPCNVVLLCRYFLLILNNSVIFWIINFTFLPSVHVASAAPSPFANIKSLYKLGLYEVSCPQWRHHIAQNCTVSEQDPSSRRQFNSYNSESLHNVWRWRPVTKGQYEYGWTVLKLCPDNVKRIVCTARYIIVACIRISDMIHEM